MGLAKGMGKILYPKCESTNSFAKRDFSPEKSDKKSASYKNYYGFVSINSHRVWMCVKEESFSILMKNV